MVVDSVVRRARLVSDGNKRSNNARIIFWPLLTRWCVEVKNLVRNGNVDVLFCGPGLDPEIIDWFFAYRQHALEYFAHIGKEAVDNPYVEFDVRGWPLPAHFLLALLAVAPLRKREKRKRLVECFAQLDPIEPLSYMIYDVIDEVLSTGGKLSWKRTVRLSQCIRCWCGVK